MLDVQRFGHLCGCSLSLHWLEEGIIEKKKKKPQNGTMQLKYKDTKNQAEEQDFTTKLLSLKFRIVTTAYPPPLKQPHP